MRGHRTGVPAAIALIAVVACVPELPKSRTWISDEVAGRTGAGLRTQRDREFALPPGLRSDDSLTIDEAIAIAIWNNAAFQRELAQLGMARADLAEAGVLPNPVVTLLFPLGAKQLELTARQALGAIWQRPRRVAAASKDASRVAETLVQRSLDVARDVQLAYASVLLAEQLLATAREAATIWSGLLKLAEARLREGDASRREVESARADARSAHVLAEQAVTDGELAGSVLRVLLGAPPGFALKLEPWQLPPMRGDVAGWTAIAFEARPDLHAAKLAVEAAGERAGLERRRIIELVGIFDMNGPGRETGPGLELPLPIFDQRQAGRMRARAELEQASWAYVGLRRQIVQEVADAHARLVRANAALVQWTADVLPARAEARRLALQGFESGEESHLVVLEATRALVDAKRRVAELEAELRRAHAELVRATGGRSHAT
ncbi:MAG: Heavy metal efflux outer membrane protein CzcC family protein [Myxococcales bacterium]|nr:Heavy metal efflux outer membrane protein CzcC family protein [Myxococcales bacterium]